MQRQLQQAGSFSQPMAEGSVLGQVGLTKAPPGGSAGNAGTSADKQGSKAAAASVPATNETNGLISGTSSDAGLELQAAKVTLTLSETTSIIAVNFCAPKPVLYAVSIEKVCLQASDGGFLKHIVPIVVILW